MWEDERRDNVTIAKDHPKTHEEDWVFGFIHYEYEFAFSLTFKHSEIFVLEPLA